MKKILFILFFFPFIYCGNNYPSPILIKGETAVKYSKSITPKDLKKQLYIIASDEFEGRKTGESGQKMTADYLKEFYISNNIASPFGASNYFQEIPTNELKPELNPSENVLAYIKGSEYPEDVIVISAHFDHLGKTEEEIYNGADDNGSGTVAIMKIAEAFQKAKEDGNGPKRSILFLHVTGEEEGLLGSKYYVSHPVFPLTNTVVDLNIDMIGRVDEAHANNPDFVYLIGSDKLSTDLHEISEAVNAKYTNLTLDYTYNDDDDPNRYYYRSDHYNFAKNNIPVIFYFNGTHQDYHQPSDTPDKINYDVLAKRTKLIFFTAWELANREDCIEVDK